MSTSTSPSTDVNTMYGFTPLPAAQSATLPATTNPSAVPVSALAIPTTPLARHVHSHAAKALPRETFLHSLRVYSYGLAIARECYPSWKVEAGSTLEETWFLTAMLHDIGTTPEHIGATKLSFEFWGGFHALEMLQTRGACREQAESVAEAIIRHQDVQDKGFVTLVTRLIHLGTLLDNIGAGVELVHPDTIRGVNEAYAREGWSGCFRDTVVREKELKGWAMVSRIEGFEEKIEANGDGLMKRWE